MARYSPCDGWADRMALLITPPIGPQISIDDAELVESFVRASGPGGQNVNKVSTAVELRFDVAATPSLTDPVAARLARLAGSKMTKEGVLVLLAQRFRTQERNRADARDRLAALILKACEPPPPPRRATRPTKASRERRLTGKAIRGDVKKLRGKGSSKGDGGDW
jgi:ribosome-associated protein